MKIEIKYKTKYDRASKRYIVYNKRYNLSGYGKTLKQAVNRFKVCLDLALTNK